MGLISFSQIADNIDYDGLDFQYPIEKVELVAFNPKCD